MYKLLRVESHTKTGEYPRIFPNFQNCACWENDLKDNKHNSLHLAQKYELRGTDYVQGQISEHIFAPNGGYCLYIFAPNRVSLKIGEYNPSNIFARVRLI